MSKSTRTARNIAESQHQTKTLVMVRPASPPARNARGQFLHGATGNPAGRPRGSRNKLGEAFIDALFKTSPSTAPRRLPRCASRTHPAT